MVSKLWWLAQVRETAHEPEPEANVGIVAMHLGLTADASAWPTGFPSMLPASVTLFAYDAARLFQQCGRYDLINELYQGSGQWERALSVAAK